MHARIQVGHPLATCNLLSNIVARASRLDERLGCLYHSHNPTEPAVDAMAAERMAQWEAALNRDGEVHEHAALAKRLSWDGLSLESLNAALRPAATPEDLPAWGDFLKEVTMVAARIDSEGDLHVGHSFTPPAEIADATPFSALWQPFLTVARRRLVKLAGRALHWLLPEAAAELAANLLRQLAVQGAHAAQERFSNYRAQHVSSAQPCAENYVPTELYPQFVASTLRDGLLSFFTEYSALARQLCLRAEQWASNVAALLARLEQDHAKICGVLFEGKMIGRVRSVRAGLSDRHRGGQQVTALEFESGDRLVYKPKNLAQEAAFHELLGWLRAAGCEPVPPPLRLLACEADYGWVQCVEPSACDDPSGVERYYQRAGGLLCVLHALGGNDCHRENIFATREGPILVDVESLLQPTWDPTAPHDGAQTSAQASVLQTGLLPLWKRGSDGEFADVSGIGGQGGRRTRLRRRVWRAINTDRMHLAEEPVFTITTPNLPTLAGQVQPPQEHAGALLDGFERCYRFLLQHRDELAADNSPLRALAQADSRLICRASNLYGKLLRALAEDPRYARDGFARSVAIEALARPLLASAQKPALWPLLKVERLAIEDGDVPFFTVAQVAGTLGIEPLSFAPNHAAAIYALSENALARQCEIIRASLLRSVEAEFSLLVDQAVTAAPAGLQSLNDSQFLGEARRLAAELAARAEADDQGVSWLSPEALRPGQDGARGAPLYFYGGASGVAFFLAALDRVTGERMHRALIAASCRPIRAFLDSPALPHWIGREPIGAALGLGGVVYSLARIGAFLGDPTYLDTAMRTARWICPERIMADTAYDVLSGAAGAILGLLTLHQLTGESSVLEAAADCGRHLCAKARSSSGLDGSLAWPTGRRGEFLAGYAHGTAGIAHALARLHIATGGEEPAFLETARAATVYERQIYSPAAGNWPVVGLPDDPPRSPVFLSTWCHGAPGIALGRIGGLDALDDVAVRQDIALALKNMTEGGLSSVDHLCCGNMGRIDIALLAATALDRPELGNLARLAASHVVGQATSAGGRYRLRTDEVENRFFETGFFRGVSGIGYTLLRLVQPQLPCALSFS